MTYEYVCQACQHQWEAEQPISADPLKDCPACGRPEAKRQISLGTGFILKGGGWYSDLYSSSSSKSKGSEGSSDAKSESKSSDTSSSSSSSLKTSDSSVA